MTLFPKLGWSWAGCRPVRMYHCKMKVVCGWPGWLVAPQGVVGGGNTWVIVPQTCIWIIMVKIARNVLIRLVCPHTMTNESTKHSDWSQIFAGWLSWWSECQVSLVSHSGRETEVRAGGSLLLPSHIFLHFLSHQLACPHPLNVIIHHYPFILMREMFIVSQHQWFIVKQRENRLLLSISTTALNRLCIKLCCH